MTFKLFDKAILAKLTPKPCEGGVCDGKCEGGCQVFRQSAENVFSDGLYHVPYYFHIHFRVDRVLPLWTILHEYRGLAHAIGRLLDVSDPLLGDEAWNAVALPYRKHASELYHQRDFAPGITSSRTNPDPLPHIQFLERHLIWAQCCCDAAEDGTDNVAPRYENWLDFAALCLIPASDARAVYEHSEWEAMLGSDTRKLWLRDQRAWIANQGFDTPMHTEAELPDGVALPTDDELANMVTKLMHVSPDAEEILSGVASESGVASSDMETEGEEEEKSRLETVYQAPQ